MDQSHAVRDLEVLVLSMKSDTTTKYTIAICVLAWVLVCLGLSVIVWMCLSFCPSLCIHVSIHPSMGFAFVYNIYSIKLQQFINLYISYSINRGHSDVEICEEDLVEDLEVFSFTEQAPVEPLLIWLLHFLALLQKSTSCLMLL